MDPKKSGQITHLELEDLELLEDYPQILLNFKYAGWYKFFSTFQGYHEQISMIFMKTFVGFDTMVGKFMIHVTEHSIGTTCRLSVYV